jgi:putative FmdB family regulatory protein
MEKKRPIGYSLEHSTMPLYEYTCTQCSSQFELLIRGGETPVCPDCGTVRVEKRLSVPAAHTRSAAALPVCDAPTTGGGCGLPQCGTGGCMGMGLGE